jgi:hypothetical protein
MLKILLYGLLLWFLYNFIFRFVVPVYKTTRDVKQKFREMHRKMQDQPSPRPGFTEPPSSQKSTAPGREGDYIEFEEIK